MHPTTPQPSITISQTLVVSPRRLSTIQESPTRSVPQQDISPPPPPPQLPSPTDRLVRNMIWKPPLWISIWFAVSSVLVTWDFLYCFLRPRSMEGGDLFWFWAPYKLYGQIDHLYGIQSFQSNNGFTNAQAFLNVIETILNLEYLYLTHTCPTTRKNESIVGKRRIGHPTAPLVGFTAAVMTLSKTLLYHLQEYYCGWCDIGHNDAKTLFWLWIIPNGAWILFPFLVVNSLGGTISTSLRNHARDLYHEEELLLSTQFNPTISSIPVISTPIEPTSHTSKPNVIINNNEEEDTQEVPSSDLDESHERVFTSSRESTPSVSIGGRGRGRGMGRGVSESGNVRRLRSRDVSLGMGSDGSGEASTTVHRRVPYE